MQTPDFTRDCNTADLVITSRDKSECYFSAYIFGQFSKKAQFIVRNANNRFTFHINCDRDILLQLLKYMLTRDRGIIEQMISADYSSALSLFDECELSEITNDHFQQYILRELFDKTSKKKINTIALIHTANKLAEFTFSVSDETIVRIARRIYNNPHVSAISVGFIARLCTYNPDIYCMSIVNGWRKGKNAGKNMILSALAKHADKNRDDLGAIFCCIYELVRLCPG